MRWATAAAVSLAAALTGTCRVGDLTNAPPPLAKLAVSPAALVDSAAVGSTLRHVWSATISNAGQGILAWTAQPTDGSSWLAVSPASGMAPGAVAITLNPAALAVGVYRDTVLLAAAEAANSPMPLPVELHVDPCTVTSVTLDLQVADSLRASDCGAPHRTGRFARLYSFTGALGDSITVTLASSAFGPYVVLDTSVTGMAPSFAETGSCLVQSGACLTYVRLPRAGTYVVEATSATTSQSGTYSLSIHRPRPPNLPDSLRQLRGDSVTAIAIGGATNQGTVVLSAVLSDPDAGDTLHLDVEVRPIGTAFTGTPTATSARVANGRHGLVAVAGLSDYTSYHWQARTGDQTGRTSAWGSFGGNAETAADFTVAVPLAPTAPTTLGQFQADGATAITLGGAATQPTVVVQAAVASPNPGDQLRLDVEVEPVGTAFTNTPIGSGVPVANPGTATATVAGLVDNVAYHWQARAVNQTGLVGPWVSFGGNAETDPDFRVALAPTQLAFTVQPSTTTAGAAITPAVQVAAEDALGNPLKSFTGTVTVALAANPGGTLAGTTTVAAVSGVATFSNLSLNKANPGYTLQATTAALSATSAAFAVTPGPATQVVKQAGDNQSAVAGTPVATAPAVLVTDANRNPVPGVAVTFGVASGGGSVSPATPVVTNASGSAALTSWTLGPAAGTNTLTATGSGLPGSPVTFTAAGTAGTATQLAIATQPAATALAGATLAPQPAVQLKDANGNAVTQANVTITATIAGGPSGATLSGATAATNATGLASFTALAIAGPVGNYTLGFGSGTLAAVTSGSITLAAGPAARLAATSVTTQAATVGTAVAAAPTVLVTDASGNPVAGVAVTFAVTAGGGSVNPTTPVVTNASGSALTAWTLGPAAGANTLTATAGGLTGSPVTFTATGMAGAATQLAITAPPAAAAQAGVALSPAPTVQLKDANGNAVSQAGVTVTATLASGPAGATLSGATAVTAASGLASFATLAIAGPVGNYTLGFTSGTLTAATSSAIAVTAGPASQLTLTTPPAATAQAGVALSPQPLVQLRDASGNPVSQANVTVATTLASGPTGATLTGATAATNASGVASFATLAIGGAAGSYTLGFSSTGMTGITSSAIVLGAGVAMRIAKQAGDNQTAAVGTAVAVPPAVLVTDAFGNFVDDVIVTFAVTAGGGSLTGATPGSNMMGVATVGGWTVGAVAGADTLTATVSGLAGSPLSFSATAVPGAATQLTITTPPAAVAQAGVPLAQQPVLQLRDANGNAVSQAGVTVTAALASGPAGATLSGATATTTGAGVASFTTLAIGGPVGSYTLGFASGSLPIVTASAIALSAGPATQVAKQAGDNQTAPAGTAVAVAPAVSVTDAFGNAVAGVPVTFAVASGGGAVNPTTPVTTAANGVAAATAWTLGTAAGANTLSATATGLTASPLIFTATGSVGGPSGVQSTIVASPATIAASSGTSPSTITVTVLDANNNAVSGASVVLAATGSGNTVAQPVGVTNASGQVTGTLSSTKAGQDTVSATVNTSITILAKAVVTVTAAAPTQLAFAVQPTMATAGQPITPAVQVNALDGFANVATALPGPVTVAIANGTGTLGAALHGTTTLSAISGVATFPTVSVDSAGSGYQLTAAANGLAGATSTAFAITAGPAAALAFSVQPTSIAAGALMTPGVQVTARDAVGNKATSFTGPVQLAFSGPTTGKLYGTLSKAAVGGVVVFSDLTVDSAGSAYTLQATAATVAATSSPFSVAAAPSVLLVGAGDISGGGYNQAATAALLARVPVNGSNTVFAAGDNAYPNGALTDYQSWYDPSWGAVKTLTRPVPGNHEYQTAGAAGYWQYYTAVSPTIAVGDSGNYWYSYDLGTWHIIALNSETAVKVGSPQELWLQADLAATTKQCKLAYWHRPYFTSGTTHPEATQAYLQPLWQDLYNAGTEIVVSGHEHHYERFAPQTAAGVSDPARGIREFVAGTGGAPLYNDETSPPVANLEVFNGTSWGVLKLTLYTSTYTWEFVPAAGATFTDQGTGSCH